MQQRLYERLKCLNSCFFEHIFDLQFDIFLNAQLKIPSSEAAPLPRKSVEAGQRNPARLDWRKMSKAM
ncbi:hypothetical protein [Rugamonas sp.]|uniref:hypothetical protein n=1 Tax=Rugamonas sp. TaxID=1926287 RepID=UPI0025CC77F1|nr:hypothetical protein [Rugamonas sp.]